LELLVQYLNEKNKKDEAQMKAEMEAELNELRKKDEKTLSELKESLEILRQSGESEEEIQKYLQHCIKSSEEISAVFQKFIQKKYVIISGMRREYSNALRSQLTSTIERVYSFTPERESYNDEIEILNLFLEGIAIVKSKEEGLPIEDTKTAVWEEMQRAYLTGSIMYLRIIDNVFGEGTLRELNRLKFLAIDDDKARENFLYKLKQRIETLKTGN